MGGALLLSRVLKGSWMERQLVLDEVAGGPTATGPAAKPALLGHLGRVVTPLHPAGRVEIDGVRYEASCAVGSIDLGATVRVVGASDFGWIVEEVTDPC
jgi:membrane-bound ClpP family serine protease